MKLSLAKDTTSKIIHVFIQDSSSYVGAGLTGLLYGAEGLTAYYIREGEGLTLLNLETIDALGKWASVGGDDYLGLKLVDDTNVPGLYELHLPNNILATGADQVVIMLHGAANMVPVLIEIQMTDPVNVVEEIAAGIDASTTGTNVTEIKAQTDQIDFTNNNPSTGKGEVISTLSSTGLDSISTGEPSGRATTFREMLIQLYMRFFNKAIKNTTTITTYDTDGTSVTEQSYTSSGGVDTVNKATDA